MIAAGAEAVPLDIVPAPDAAVVADNLVEADLRGVDSHGIHLLALYAARLREGHLRADAKVTVLRDDGATVHLDGGLGRGQVAGLRACDIAVERARAGVFLAMQYPVEVTGVTVSNFLRTAATAVRGEAPKLRTWVKEVKEAMDRLQMDPAFAERNVNEGFSGGEKKRHEILQLELLRPRIAVLDETDSGLDVDALRIVSEGVNRVRETGEIGTLLITHYTRILRYIKPDHVHVFAGGRIVESGGPELADKLEAEGYEAYTAAPVEGGAA